METVTLDRRIDADPDGVRAAMADLEPFMLAAGFDEVTVDGDRIRIANGVGLFEIELNLAVVDVEGADLAYRQREGIFREMTTTYEVERRPEGCEVTATTEFAVDAKFAGPLLDATVIKRQRRKELRGQFDYLEDAAQTGRG